MNKILMFLVICFPLCVCAEIVEGNDCGETENDVCIWRYDTDTKTLTVSGRGAMKDYNNVRVGQVRHDLEEVRVWRNIANDVKHVVVEDGITSIGDRSFEYMDNVESIKIADSVTLLGYYALAWMDNVREIIMPANLQTVPADEFSHDLKLENLYCSEQTLSACQNALDHSAEMHLMASLYVKNEDGSVSYYQNNDKGWMLVKKKNARIYTVEEATRLSKPDGNIIRLRYK